jgi:hypothetical protein
MFNNVEIKSVDAFFNKIDDEDDQRLIIVLVSFIFSLILIYVGVNIFFLL